MDFYLSQLMIQRDDFNNGVTEVLINKKKNTKWNPSSTVNINKKINNYLTFDINELDIIIEITGDRSNKIIIILMIFN